MEPFISYRGIVHQWHCDHMGHMNTMWYTGKFDEASWNLVARIGITPAYLRDTMRGMASVEHKVAYLHELLAGDLVEVRSHLREVREKAILLRHEMFNGETGVLAATNDIVGVHFDRRARKACAFSPEMRAAAERFLLPASEAAAQAA